MRGEYSKTVGHVLRTAAFRCLCHLIVIIVFGVSAVFISPHVARAQGARISISPGEGVMGSTVTVTGSGFPTGTEFAWITLTMAGQSVPLGLQALNADGTFSVDALVPQMDPGVKTVMATASSASASTSFTIVPPEITLNPTRGEVGSTVDVMGIGFPEGTDGNLVNLIMDGQTLPLHDETLNSDGTFSVTASIPQIDPGVKTITATAASFSASASFMVVSAGTPEISVSPAAGLPGSNINIEGAGFPGLSQVFITMDNADIASGETDRAGKFSVGATVPELPSGDWPVTAVSGDARASAPFSIVLIASPQIFVSPDNGTPGSTIDIDGSGFPPSSSISLTIDGTAIGPDDILTDEAGEFSVSADIPEWSPGGRAVTAASGAATASAAFEIVAPTEPGGIPWTWLLPIIILFIGGAGYLLRRVIPHHEPVVTTRLGGESGARADISRSPDDSDHELRLRPVLDPGRQDISSVAPLITRERREGHG